MVDCKWKTVRRYGCSSSRRVGSWGERRPMARSRHAEMDDGSAFMLYLATAETA